MRKNLLSLAAACLFLAAAPAPVVAGSEQMDPPKPLPDFTLQDHDGAPFTLNALTGRWSLIAVGYTGCPDICPFTLSNLEAVRAELAAHVSPERLPQVVFLAVDPARDRPVLRDYVRHFHPEFRGVTGEAEAVAALLTGLEAKAVIGQPDAAGNYDVAHSVAVAVVSPDGRLVGKLTPPLDPAETAAFLARQIRQSTRAGGPP